MKKVLQSIATIVLLGAIAFLICSEWPENIELTKVLLYDGGAVAVILGSGLYLKYSGAFDEA